MQNTLTYRGPMVVWAISNIISTTVFIAIWQSSTSSGSIAGYTKPELIAYYVIGLFLQWFTGWMPFYWIKDQIKDGSIVGSVLTKPVSFYWEVFFQEAGWHIISIFMGIAATLVFFPIIGNFLVKSFSLTLFATASLASIGTIFLIFTFSLCMGMLAFWLTHITSIDSLFWIAKSLLGGQGIPLAFFPVSLLGLVNLLPFRYMFSFPLEIYLGKLNLPQQLYGFGLQLFWIIVFVIIYKFMWSAGRKSYSSFGN